MVYHVWLQFQDSVLTPVPGNVNSLFGVDADPPTLTTLELGKNVKSDMEVFIITRWSMNNIKPCIHVVSLMFIDKYKTI